MSTNYTTLLLQALGLTGLAEIKLPYLVALIATGLPVVAVVLNVLRQLVSM